MEPPARSGPIRLRAQPRCISARLIEIESNMRRAVSIRLDIVQCLRAADLIQGIDGFCNSRIGKAPYDFFSRIGR